VVNHSQNEIRDALHVARHDHMSSADCFVCPTRLMSLPLLIDLVTFQDGASLRAATCDTCDPPTEASAKDVARAAFVVNEANREEVRGLDGELAIVSPLVDGRLLDVAAGAA
jgi:hypothetical protein